MTDTRRAERPPWFENPVFVKEVKSKMRSRHSRPAQVAVACVVVLVVGWINYQGFGLLLGEHASRDGAADGFQAALVLQAVLIWLFGPAFAANSITQEKEQQTWEMLVFTKLSGAEVLLGKLAARLVPGFAVQIAAAPFMAAAAVLGEVGFGHYLAVNLAMTIWTVFLVTTSLFMSWAFKRTSAAITMSYLVLFALTIGTIMVHSTLRLAFEWDESLVWWLNPGRVVSAMLDKNDAWALPVLLFSHAVYLLVTGALLWRMFARFRASMVE